MARTQVQHTETCIALSIEEFRQAMHLGRTQVFEEIKTGRLAAKKVGRRTIITWEEAQRWLNALPPATPGRGVKR